MALPALLRAEFGDTPVAIDNDVNAGAAAELRWGALRGVDVGLYINPGTGLGALVTGNRVLPGAAGEIGYLRDRDTDPSSPAATQWRRAPGDGAGRQPFARSARWCCAW